MNKKGAQDTAYSRENEVVLKYKAIFERVDLTPQEYQQAMNEFLKQYENLLADTKLLTSVGDRLQRKLKSANLMMTQQAEEINRINSNLEANNKELKETIDELTRARASRKAQAYLLIVAVLLFILSELIEDKLTILSNNFFINMGFKLMLLFPFKFAESYLEKYFLRQAIAEDKREMVSKYASTN